MISIGITKFNDEILEIVRYEPFAWFSWPLEMIDSVCSLLIETSALMRDGSCVVMKSGWVQEIFVPTGTFGKPTLHQILRTTKLMPCRTVTRYEDRSDYEKAKDGGEPNVPILGG